MFLLPRRKGKFLQQIFAARPLPSQRTCKRYAARAFFNAASLLLTFAMSFIASRAQQLLHVCCGHKSRQWQWQWQWQSQWLPQQPHAVAATAATVATVATAAAVACWGLLHFGVINFARGLQRFHWYFGLLLINFSLVTAKGALKFLFTLHPQNTHVSNSRPAPPDPRLLCCSIFEIL